MARDRVTTMDGGDRGDGDGDGGPRFVFGCGSSKVESNDTPTEAARSISTDRTRCTEASAETSRAVADATATTSDAMFAASLLLP